MLINIQIEQKFNYHYRPVFFAIFILMYTMHACLIFLYPDKIIQGVAAAYFVACALFVTGDKMCEVKVHGSRFKVVDATCCI